MAVTQSPVWFLLYWQSDSSFNGELVSRMAALGAKAISVTVDMPTPGDRRRQFRAGFKIPDSLATPYFKDRNTGVLKVGTAQRRAMPTWADIAWLRSLTTLPLILKGILDPDDAEQAIGTGADAIVVSNHGSRGRIEDDGYRRAEGNVARPVCRGTATVQSQVPGEPASISHSGRIPWAESQCILCFPPIGIQLRYHPQKLSKLMGLENPTFTCP
jgi:hypothetical protein